MCISLLCSFYSNEDKKITYSPQSKTSCTQLVHFYLRASSNYIEGFCNRFKILQLCTWSELQVSDLVRSKSFKDLWWNRAILQVYNHSYVHKASYKKHTSSPLAKSADKDLCFKVCCRGHCAPSLWSQSYSWNFGTLCCQKKWLCPYCSPTEV